MKFTKREVVEAIKASRGHAFKARFIGFTEEKRGIFEFREGVVGHKMTASEKVMKKGPSVNEGANCMVFVKVIPEGAVIGSGDNQTTFSQDTPFIGGIEAE